MPRTTRRASWILPLVLAVLCSAGVWTLWKVFVTTRRGQIVDQLSLSGAYLGGMTIQDHANSGLQRISVGGVAAAIVLVMVVALARRRWVLAIEAAAVIAGANLTTQALKYWAFSRPDFEGFHIPYPGNTLPSGHTTAAASALLAALLVAPKVLRLPVAMVAAVGISGFGWATMAAQWHRPSDVVAAVLVCLAWAFGVLGISILRQRHVKASAAELRSGPRPILAWTVLAVGLGTAFLTGAAWAGWTVRGAKATRRLAHEVMWTAYFGGVAGIVGVTLVGVGVLMRLVQTQEPVGVDD